MRIHSVEPVFCVLAFCIHIANTISVYIVRTSLCDSHHLSLSALHM